ncbi:hypothetical protein B566_EDAN004517 [Ephemera danica]|nr:hypothetical protein B566_EDAN004517 [Ephemera danica]
MAGVVHGFNNNYCQPAAMQPYPKMQQPVGNQHSFSAIRDMALIEVLWKQDVDLGVPLDVFAATAAAEPGLETAETPGKEAPSCLVDTDPDCKTDSSREQLPATSAAFADTKGAAAAASSSGSSSGSGITDLGDADDEEDEDGPLTALDPWAGLPYTIDLETECMYLD